MAAALGQGGKRVDCLGNSVAGLKLGAEAEEPGDLEVRSCALLNSTIYVCTCVCTRARVSLCVSCLNVSVCTCGRVCVHGDTSVSERASDEFLALKVGAGLRFREDQFTCCFALF
jgi:hypothetical protein